MLGWRDGPLAEVHTPLVPPPRPALPRTPPAGAIKRPMPTAASIPGVAKSPELATNCRLLGVIAAHGATHDHASAPKCRVAQKWDLVLALGVVYVTDESIGLAGSSSRSLIIAVALLTLVVANIIGVIIAFGVKRQYS
jgi:hypothetical protein